MAFHTHRIEKVETANFFFRPTAIQTVNGAKNCTLQLIKKYMFNFERNLFKKRRVQIFAPNIEVYKRRLNITSCLE